MSINNQLKEQLYQGWQQMLRIRLFEQTVAKHYAKQEMRCPVHLSIGQEAIAVGVCQNLAIQDKVYSNHRSHAHYLAKGGDMVALIAEFYGLANGCVGGWGGSMHLMDLAVGFAGSTPIVGGTVPIATGAAWAQKLQCQPYMTVSFLGDGCFEEGVVAESLNFAALHQLPILFVLENNQYSVYTPLEERQPKRKMYEVAQAMGLKALVGDGNRLSEVMDLTQQAFHILRQGKGSVFLELATYRWPEHCGPNDDDHLGYRPQGELALWQKRCPILQVQQQLNLSVEKIETIRQRLQNEIDQAWQQALKGKIPSPEELEASVYA